MSQTDKPTSSKSTRPRYPSRQYSPSHNPNANPKGKAGFMTSSVLSGNTARGYSARAKGTTRKPRGKATEGIPNATVREEEIPTQRVETPANGLDQVLDQVSQRSDSPTDRYNTMQNDNNTANAMATDETAANQKEPMRDEQTDGEHTARSRFPSHSERGARRGRAFIRGSFTQTQRSYDPDRAYGLVQAPSSQNQHVNGSDFVPAGRLLSSQRQLATRHSTDAWDLPDANQPRINSYFPRATREAEDDCAAPTSFARPDQPPPRHFNGRNVASGYTTPPTQRTYDAYYDERQAEMRHASSAKQRRLDYGTRQSREPSPSTSIRWDRCATPPQQQKPWDEQVMYRIQQTSTVSLPGFRDMSLNDYLHSSDRTVETDKAALITTDVGQMKVAQYLELTRRGPAQANAFTDSSTFPPFIRQEHVLGSYPVAPSPQNFHSENWGGSNAFRNSQDNAGMSIPRQMNDNANHNFHSENWGGSYRFVSDNPRDSNSALHTARPQRNSQQGCLLMTAPSRADQGANPRNSNTGNSQDNSHPAINSGANLPPTPPELPPDFNRNYRRPNFDDDDDRSSREDGDHRRRKRVNNNNNSDELTEAQITKLLPKHFDEKGEKDRSLLEDWLNMFEHLASSINLSDETRLKRLSLLVPPDVFRVIKNEGSNATYRQVLRRLHQRYVANRTKEEWQDIFHAVKQNFDEDLKSYGGRFEDAFRRGYPDGSIDQPDIISKFLRGLSLKPMGYKLSMDHLSHPFTTFHQCLSETDKHDQVSRAMYPPRAEKGRTESTENEKGVDGTKRTAYKAEGTTTFSDRRPPYRRNVSASPLGRPYQRYNQTKQAATEFLNQLLTLSNRQDTEEEEEEPSEENILYHDQEDLNQQIPMPPAKQKTKAPPPLVTTTKTSMAAELTASAAKDIQASLEQMTSKFDEMLKLIPRRSAQENNRSDNRSGSTDRRKSCFLCNKDDHFYRDCPSASAEQKKNCEKLFRNNQRSRSSSPANYSSHPKA